MLRAVLVATLAVVSVVAVGSERLAALPGDGDSPRGCSDTLTQQHRPTLNHPDVAIVYQLEPIPIFFLTRGYAQMRFSDHCNSIWSRTCSAEGFEAYDGRAWRVNVRNSSTINYYYTSLRRGGVGLYETGSNVCSTFPTTQKAWSTHRVFTDCIERYKVACQTKTSSKLGKNGKAVAGWVDSGGSF